MVSPSSCPEYVFLDGHSVFKFRLSQDSLTHAAYVHPYICNTIVRYSGDDRKASYDHNTICMQSSSSFTLSVLCIVCSQLRKSAMGVHGNLWAASKISGHSLQEPCIWPYQRSRGTLLAGHRTLRYSYIFLAEAKSQIVPPRRGSLQHSIHSRDICHTSAI